MIALVCTTEVVDNEEEAEISNEESKEDLKEASKYKSANSKVLISFDKYMNNRVMACYYIAGCLFRTNKKSIEKLSGDEEGSRKIQNYIHSDLMKRCYAKMTELMANSIVSRPEDECDCNKPDIKTVITYIPEAYQELGSGANIGEDYYNMMLAVDDMKKRAEKKQTNMEKDSKPMLFGQELGKAIGKYQLLFAIAIVAILVIIFVVMVKKLTKEKKPKKKNNKEKSH